MAERKSLKQKYLEKQQAKTVVIGNVDGTEKTFTEKEYYSNNPKVKKAREQAGTSRVVSAVSANTTQNNKTVKVDEIPSKVDLKTGTTTYGSTASASKKVDGKALVAQLERDAATSELSSIFSRAAEDQAARGSTRSQPTDLSREVQVEKTPAPRNLDQTTVSTVKDLIKADPPSEKIQNAIEGYKDTYPEVFDGVSPIDNDLLSPEEQIKRFNLIKTHKMIPVPDSITTGFVIISPNPCKDSTFDQMGANLNNFFSKINATGSVSLNLPNEIKQMSKVMSRGMNGYVNKITGSLNDKMAELMSSGFDGIATAYQTKADLGLIPYSKAIELIRTEQEGLLPSISSLLDGVDCIGPKIMDSLSGTISDLLTSAMKNTTNVPSCAVEQMMGAVTNDIANTIDDAISPLLGPLTTKFGIDFDIKGFVLGGVDVFKRVDAFLSCDDKQNCPSTDKTIIGKGNQMAKSVGDIKSNFKNIFDSSSLNALSNVANQVKTPFEEKYGSWDIFGGSSSNTTSLSPCNAGNPTKCGAPTVDIFGGGGVGASGKIIFGKFINRLDTEDIFAPVERTASIVGVEITDPGSGYNEDPIVKFNDNCNQGFGAYAKAHIDPNPQSPTYGQLSSITILTSGENYPVEDDEVPLFISKVIIENKGEGYTENDTLENFNLNITDGRITGGKMINDIPYDDLPNLNINSDTGVGAILRPIMSKTRPQGEVIQVIDCVS